MQTPESIGQGTSQEPVEEAPEVDLVEVAECEGQQRLWIRAIMPIIHGCPSDSDPSEAVRGAHDKMYIVACKRLMRLLRSDLIPPAHPGYANDEG